MTYNIFAQALWRNTMNKTKQVFVCTVMVLMPAVTGHALPSFVTDPPPDGQYYYEFGEAEGKDATQAWKLAEERARESLRHQIETRVKAIQIDYEARTGQHTESFFTEVLNVTSEVTVQAKRVKSEYEGGKYYVLVSTEGIEEEVLKRVIEQTQKANDPDFERLVKESMKRTSNKAEAVIQQVDTARRKAEAGVTREKQAADAKAAEEKANTKAVSIMYW
jgi:hypothetical protein